jgi:hypothetical protein
MLQADNQKNEGPGRLIGVRPRALGAQRLSAKRFCRFFMPALPGAVQCLGEGGVGRAGRAELSALQLPAVRSAGADLSALRSRPALLPR